jgi:hypothetical protein
MEVKHNPRSGRGRADHLKGLVAGAYVDTGPVVQAIVKESAYHGAWRPVRAAAILAMAAKENVATSWMTAEEFEALVKAAGMEGRRRGSTERLREDLGMTSLRRQKLLNGSAEASKIEALACAHLSLRFPMPVPAGDCAAFGRWVMPRFGAVEPVADFLGVRGAYILDRVKGFEITRGERRPRSPEPDLIRALDWLWRMGPVNPFGKAPRPPLWPGQEVDHG